MHRLAIYFADRFECRHLIDLNETLRGREKEQEIDDEVFVRVQELESKTDNTMPDRNTPWILSQLRRIPLNKFERSILIARCMSSGGAFDVLDAASYVMEKAPLGLIYQELDRMEDAPSESETSIGDSRIPNGPDSFRRALESRGFDVVFCGFARPDLSRLEADTLLAIVETTGRVWNESSEVEAIPSAFQVVALMSAYNEADVIETTLSYLIEQGIDVYLIDNWSTDRTSELAEKFLGKGLIGIEKFPAEAPPVYFSWKAILRRFEDLARHELEADWFMLQGADEIRSSPWPELSMRQAIYRVDRAGYNAIDHTVMEFCPIDNSFREGSDFIGHFKYFRFPSHHAYFKQSNTWKNRGLNVDLCTTGGHQAKFERRLIYPFKFLLRHYPIRSQQHGERKVFRERIPRWDPDEKTHGWHNQYDQLEQGENFLHDIEELIEFDAGSFYEEYLVERLTGVGIRARARLRGD
jgi:hypothetical protein